MSEHITQENKLIPVVEVLEGKWGNRLQWMSDEVMGETPVGTKLYAISEQTVMALENAEQIRIAAQAVIRQALDDVNVHPCDVNDDTVRSHGLYEPLLSLYRALNPRK